MAVALAVPADFLRVSDLNADQLLRLLELAAEMKAHPYEYLEMLEGDALACHSEGGPAPGRAALVAAAGRVGMEVITLRPDELAGLGETLAEAARVLSGHVAALALWARQRTTDDVAAAATAPVVNAGSDVHHPCQTVADLLTLRERFGVLERLKMAFIGPVTNVTYSLLEAGSILGMRVALHCPPEHRPPEDAIAAAHRRAQASGGDVELVESPEAAVQDAAAVYTSAWPACGAEQEKSRAKLAPYRVTAELMGMATPDAIFMHSLPVHRGEEVTGEVADGPQSAVLEQAANRLPAHEAVLAVLVLHDWPVETG
jgi:ornithine carbamoyltransferase